MKRYKYYDVDMSNIHPGFHDSGMKKVVDGNLILFEDIVKLIKDEIEEWNNDSRDKLSDGAIYGLDRLLHLVERD